MKRKILSILVALALLVSMVTVPVLAATEEEIETSIQDGLDWLVPQQQANGAWPGYEPVARTAFAVVKLEDRAYELGYDSPFDPEYAYSENVKAGLNYILRQAGTYGPGTGV